MMSPSRNRKSHRLDRVALVHALLTWALLVVLMAPALAFERQPVPPVGDETRAEEESHDEGSLLELIARLVNFGILAGLVIYVAKSPILTYLRERRDQLRADLVHAAQLRKTANEQIADIDSRLTELPGELEALHTQGAAEIAAEETRIGKEAATARERVLEQTRRELDLQVRVARDELRVRAAELATAIARTRITERMTPAEQERLLDRYVDQLANSEGGS